MKRLILVKLASISTFIVTAFCLGILIGKDPYRGRTFSSSTVIGTHYDPGSRQAWVLLDMKGPQDRRFARLNFDNQPNEYALVVRSEMQAGLVHAVAGPVLGFVVRENAVREAIPVSTLSTNATAGAVAMRALTQQGDLHDTGSVPAATYHSHGTVRLPDPVATPGVVRTSDATELCAPGFTTRKYRHTTAVMKAQVYAEYGAQKVPGVCCEVDHLIPLELGGADDVRNLWPQPYKPAPGAHEKDRLENYLREVVCSSGMGTVTTVSAENRGRQLLSPLEEAQHALQTDWYTAFLKYGLDRNRSLGVYNPKRGTHP